MSTRFVVVASTRRGVIDPPEELDEAGQAAAFWRLREDESQSLRVAFELGMNEARVIWKKPVKSYEPAARVDRMMAISARARIA